MQSMYAQCWDNAYTSKSPYKVAVDSKNKAVGFRAQCHRYRRKIAEEMYGPGYEEHYLYELEVTIEDGRDGPLVVFQRRARVILPPVDGVESGMWCVMKKEDGFAVERHQIPVTAEGFVSGHETEEAARRAITEMTPKRPIFG